MLRPFFAEAVDFAASISETLRKERSGRHATSLNSIKSEG
jgi:hypothetical protein